MLSEINNSKEAIRNRMLKHALNYWDIKNTEDLDPAVKLILEALSVELYNLANEVKDTQVRLLEKIANLLAPESLTSPNPAHAVLHATAAEPVELLTNTTNFYTQRKVSSKPNEPADTNLDIFFTPVDTVQIFDAQILCSINGSNLFGYDQFGNRQVLARTISGKPAENNAVWIGLRMNEKIEDINNLYFYFDWKNMEPKIAGKNFQLLPVTKWYLNNEELKTASGIPYVSDGNDNDTDAYVDLDYNLLNLLEKDIKHYYDHKYITVTDKRFKNIYELKETFPASIKRNFKESDLQKLSEKLLWIKISFPAALQQESLDEVYIYLNAFPVVNRQLTDLNFRLKGGSNIIPLKTSPLEQFLAVKSLTDDTNTYKSVPYRKMDEEQTGTYTLRTGGVERFDTRNARELISYLVELLRSESATFSAYGYDFIATTLKEMNQRIALIEQKTKGYLNNAAEIPNYIIVKPFEGFDMMYIEYWTTLAEAANTVRSGTRLQQMSGAKVKPDSVVLLTTTVGGKNRLRPEERLHAFRYGIMTRNRIITKEDIRNFCFYELGDRISEVNVERGFEMSPHPQQSFRRTIDVILIPSDAENLDTAEWQILCDQVKSKLQSRSGVSNNYRILLGKAEK